VKVEKKIRRDFYQVGDFVVVNLYERNASKDETRVEFSPKKFKFSVKCSDGQVVEETVALKREIIPDQCKFSVLGPKIEIKLRKMQEEWDTL